MSGAHESRAHALLSASSAKQWIACPPSIRASEHIKGSSSVYAREGTFAHELSELYFARAHEGMTARTFNSRLKKMKMNDFYSAELDEYVKGYVDYVAERVNAAKGRDKAAGTDTLMLFFETQLDLSTYVPESFGTGDVIIYAAGELEIIDLKYGKGVKVSAVDNPQLRLYGLGASELISMFDDVQEVTTTIVQPRLYSITSETLTLSELETWGREVVAPRALLAFEGKGDFNAGEHCQYCGIKASCRARAEANLKTAEKKTEPYLLTNDELIELLYKVDELAKWAKDVKSYALIQAQQGNTLEGFKLVEGKRSRTISDTAQALEILKLSYDEKDLTTPAQLKSIAQIEKVTGKKNAEELIGHLVITSSGAPTLVEESDKRPAINDAAAEFEVLD